MTKFILAGGYMHKAPDGGKAFCEELVRGKAEPVKILDCMFAHLEERWHGVFGLDSELFTKNLPGVDIDLRPAGYESFVDDVAWADVIFFSGGSSGELVQALLERPEWKQHLKGKTVAGTSAGADALSTWYFGLHARRVMPGTGLVHAKVIPHFQSDYHGWEFDWDGALKELVSHEGDIPVYALKEGEFVVVSRNESHG